VTTSESSAATGTTNPIGSLWVGAALPTVLAIALFTVVALIASPADAASVLVGGGMALVALSASPLLQRLCRNLEPSLVLGIAVLAYCLVIIALGIVYRLLRDQSWLHGGFAGASVAIAAAVWAAGHMWTALKLRQPLYDLEESSAGH
jgi:hypothetical protein